MAIQINGKTRDVLKVKKDISERELNQLVLERSKARKYLEKIDIIKVIFVKNKIINYITKN